MTTSENTSPPVIGRRPHQVAVIGGGFGGLEAVRALARMPVEVTLIDRTNAHLFQPLLYQVATGGLSPANIASPLRSLFRRNKNVRVLLGEVNDLNVGDRCVQLKDGGEFGYDTLILACGSGPAYFGHEEWEPFAPSLKTIESATIIRSRILLAFEAAERESDPAAREAWLTFVISGGGPTGVELAGAAGEMARLTLREDFRRIDPAEARILLVELKPRILASYPEDLSAKAAATLDRLGVTILTETRVVDVQPNHAILAHAGNRTEKICTHNVFWMAGVRASSLTRRVSELTGAELDKSGRVKVRLDLSVPGHPEILVIGDMATFPGPDGHPLPGLAPVAMQQGRYAARLIQARLQGRTLAAFRYSNRGEMATVGRSAAVVNLGWLRFNGLLAWVTWLFVHLLYLVEFENRVLVLIQWAWSYFTLNRSARLITRREPFGK